MTGAEKFDPDDALATAIGHHQAGRIADAVALYRRVLEVEPANVAALVNLGAALRGGGEAEAAADCFRRAVEAEPGHAGAHYNLGNALRDQERFEDAAAAYRRALDIAPEMAAARNNLGDCLGRLGDWEAAVASFERALEAEPGNAEALNNLGNALLRRGRVEDAVARLRQAVARAPANPEFLANLGNALRDAGNERQALACYEAALAADPGHAGAHCLRAFALLSMGRFGEGWDEYEWRWRQPGFEPERPFTAPRWDGSALDGKTILVWGEQGVGDEIMFASLLAELKERCGSGGGVLLECEHRLAPLFERSLPGIAVTPRTDPPAAGLAAAVDWQLPLGSLGRFLRRDAAAVPPPQPFLTADPAQVEAIRRRYAEPGDGARLIGLSWRSGNRETGPKRSTVLADWLPVLKTPKCRFVSLQYGDVEDEVGEVERALGVGVHLDAAVDQMRDMDAFAAQVAALDAVVSVANTTVHVAGGLGVETLVLTPFPADWRWLRGRADSPWYADVELFRQAEGEDRTAPIGRIAERLRLRKGRAP